VSILPQNKAKATEEFFNGKSLNDTSTVQGALEILDKEMESIPTESNKLSGSVEYRKGLVKSLLYKVRFNKSFLHFEYFKSVQSSNLVGDLEHLGKGLRRKCLDAWTPEWPPMLRQRHSKQGSPVQRFPEARSCSSVFRFDESPFITRLYPSSVVNISQWFKTNYFAGEAEYTNDVPQAPGELFGAFVLSSVGNATLDTIDTTTAMVSHYTSY